MVIYLRHPVHGTKVAISDVEAAQDVRNGWVIFTLNSPVVEVASEPEPVNNLPRRRRSTM